MSVAIRTAVAADIAAMHEVRLSVRENRLTSPRSISEDDYRPYIDAGSAWVADDSGAVRGFAALDVTSCVVWALFVAPDAEGQGIGGALHDALVDYADSRGLGDLRLTTEAGSRAERFYAKHRWKTADTLANGDVAMTLDLNAASEPR